jgi:hypothetical protein
MRINMSRWLIAIAPVLLIGCSPSTAEDELYGAGFIIVNEQTWGENHTSPYPFTVAGEISCGSHPEFGREVYFEPVGYTDESNIGTPLNKSAVDSLDRDNMKANVPYSIKKGADLSDAIQIGLRVCDEQQDNIKNS